MAAVGFSVFDYLVFIFTLVFSALIGAFFWLRDRKTQSNRDYLTGGRNLSIFPVTMSLAASFMSTNTLLGTPAEIYLLGTQFALGTLSFIIAVIFAAELFMPIYYDLELTSVNKYLLRRFGANAIRIVGSIGFVLCTIPYLGAVLYGPALALSAVTELTITTSILVVGVVCTFYTAVGGLKAVIWSDVFQCILMILGVLMVVILGIRDVGFLEPFKIAEQEGRLNILNFSMGVHRSDTVWATGFGILVGWSGTYCVKQTQVQRYCCMESKKAAKKAIYWSIPSVVIINLLSIWCGIILVAKYRGCDPISMKMIERYDQLMPHYVMESLSDIPGLPGLFVACVFSGSLRVNNVITSVYSTLSSGFNALATITWEDFIKRFCTSHSEKSTVILNKFVATLYGVLVIGIAFLIGRLGTVLQASIAMSGAITGPLLGLFCLGIFCPCVNAKGAFAGITSGVLLTLTIAFGSVVNKKPPIHLPLRTDECSTDIIEVYGNQEPKPYYLPGEFDPQGVNKLFHISYFFISVVGLVTCLVVGILVSYITGRSKDADPKYVSPSVLKLLRWKNEAKNEDAEEDAEELKVLDTKTNNNVQKMMNPVIDEVKKRIENKQRTDNPLMKENNVSPTENRRKSLENAFNNEDAIENHKKIDVSPSTYV